MNLTVVSDFREGYDVGLELSYARAFASLGHSVSKVSLSSTLDQTSPWVPGRLRRVVTAHLRQEALTTEVLRTQPEVVVLVKGMGVLESAVRHWRSQGIRVVSVFPDNPFDARRATWIEGGLLAQWRALDRLFVHDRYAVGQMRELGVASRFIAFAWDPAVHDVSKLAPAHKSEEHSRIAFVGNPDAERIRYLRAVADLGLGLWGNWSWAKLDPSDPLSSCIRGPEATGQAMVECLHRAALSINVLRPSQKTAHNMRTFESPACQVCTLSESSPGVLEFFEDGGELAAFSTPTELRQLAIELLHDDPRRNALAQAGWKRVQKETYAHRAAEVLSELDSAGEPVKQP